MLTISYQNIYTDVNKNVPVVWNASINIEEKAHAGNATQNIHPPLMQDTHTTEHTASLIHLLVKITRMTYTTQM